MLLSYIIAFLGHLVGTTFFCKLFRTEIEQELALAVCLQSAKNVYSKSFDHDGYKITTLCLEHC